MLLCLSEVTIIRFRIRGSIRFSHSSVAIFLVVSDDDCGVIIKQGASFADSYYKSIGGNHAFGTKGRYDARYARRLWLTALPCKRGSFVNQILSCVCHICYESTLKSMFETSGFMWLLTIQDFETSKSNKQLGWWRPLTTITMSWAENREVVCMPIATLHRIISTRKSIIAFLLSVAFLGIQEWGSLLIVRN